MSDFLSPEERQRASELIVELQKRQKFNKLTQIELYPWQHRAASSSATHSQTMVCCANQVGKSLGGAAITAYHLTGKYPEGWEGHRYTHPIYAWAAGVSGDTTRDIVQAELFGEPTDPESLGTGMVPKEDIVDIVRRRGASGNAYDAVIVKHYDEHGTHDGNSRISFKSYEMGEEKFFGRSIHWIWLDEQPPDNIYTQCLTRTVATGGKILMTFTPESGITKTVHQFFNERGPGQDLIQATWDDAPHLDKATKDQLLSQYPEHERKMRAEGIPFFGSGLVYPVDEGAIKVEPFEIPEHWPAIAGMDFGWENDTAVVWLRWDRDADIVYLVDEYAANHLVPLMHSGAIKSRPICPVAWPHDGVAGEKGSGVGLADQYRNHGIKMMAQHFTNPPVPGLPNGDIRVEPGISSLLERMQTGRFKVFSTCMKWLNEFKMYSRKDGKIIKKNDHLMDATRYAEGSLRFAEKPSGAMAFAKAPKLDDYWIV